MRSLQFLLFARYNYNYKFKADKIGSLALQTVHVLLNHEADPYIVNKDGWTALHIACRTGHCDIVELLLENFPALVNKRSTNGRYPLHTAGKYCTVPFTSLPLIS
jgi:ankyrin repeat protein